MNKENWKTTLKRTETKKNFHYSFRYKTIESLPCRNGGKKMELI